MFKFKAIKITLVRNLQNSNTLPPPTHTQAHIHTHAQHTAVRNRLVQCMFKKWCELPGKHGSIFIVEMRTNIACKVAET
jgi:hypothetical protein